ncbi:hypothetical protein PIB30_072191 [Stylosanthes scabra]|uniref:Uncharacterized protein n=1 Tax=Stylosanthes scabra TaxID=79078 RepID=A0ABU6WNP6_9FABA|nr:hypothetical protein [Stylosanthes scabra]
MEEEIGSIINIHHHHQGYGYEAESSCVNEGESNKVSGPTWSTTPPSLLEEPPASSSTIEECCWLGFLEGLEDNGKMVISSDDDHYLDLDQPLGLGHGVVDSSNNNKVSSNELSSPFVDELLELSYCPDDWLVGDTTIGE